MLNRRADKLELLRIAEAVALEKSIDKELIIKILSMCNIKNHWLSEMEYSLYI